VPIEPQLLLALGDSTTARAELRSALATLRNAEPLAPFNAGNNSARMAAALRAMTLFASLAPDRGEAVRWYRVPALFWRSANQNTLPSAASVKAHAGS
jgi:hypothetical protein